MERFCALQERSHKEVRTKLLTHFIYGDLLEDIIVHLIQNNFLNEERFAVTFARGKFRIKKWGKIKITQALKLHDVSQYAINVALDAIERKDYMDTLSILLMKKVKTIRCNTKFELQNKLTSYALQKGYAYNDIQEVLEDIKF